MPPSNHETLALVRRAHRPWSRSHVASSFRVGPGLRYETPCQAVEAAVPGDTIEIEASGHYSGDVCKWSKNGLTLRGVRGRARIEAAGRSAQSKAIWVIAGDDRLIENIELFGSKVPDHNGAGIRHEDRNLTIRNCCFHNNEEGLLTANRADSEVLVEFSEFADNGSGNGQTHNLYIGRIAKFTLRFSYSHHARTGHLVKSRCAELYSLQSVERRARGNGEL